MNKQVSFFDVLLAVLAVPLMLVVSIAGFLICAFAPALVLVACVGIPIWLIVQILNALLS